LCSLMIRRAYPAAHADVRTAARLVCRPRCQLAAERCTAAAALSSHRALDGVEVDAFELYAIDATNVQYRVLRTSTAKAAPTDRWATSPR
jgi:hypothetical protein